MTMRGLLLLGCALISAGCATARSRPILGHAHLSVVEPQTVTQTITSVGLIVEDGGVIVDGAHRCERHQNCLRGFWGLREASYCPSGKDEEGLQWWKSNGIDGNSFGTRYLKEQGVVQVVLGRFEAFVLLGPGMPHDELRYEPELVAIVFLSGAVPMSKDGRYVLTDDALDKPADAAAKEPPQDEKEKKLPKEAEFRPPPSARGR